LKKEETDEQEIVEDVPSEPEMKAKVFRELEEKLKSRTVKEQLDLFIYYLATVHCHVYYSCSTFPANDRNTLESIYRATEKHPQEDAENFDAIGWAENLEKKINTSLNLDLQLATGERKAAEFLESFYNEKIIKDSPERFRCEICSKMFKGPLFVKKHISVKHPEKLEEIREKAREEQFYRNYVSHCDKMVLVKEKEEREKKKEEERKLQEERQKEREKREKERKEKREKSPDKKDKILNKDKGDREKRKSDSKSPSRVEKTPRAPIDKNLDLRSGKPRSPKGSPSRAPNERDSSPERRNNMRRGSFDNSHRGRGGGFGNRFNYRRGPFQLDEELPPPPEFRDKMDPRSKSQFVF